MTDLNVKLKSRLGRSFGTFQGAFQSRENGNPVDTIPANLQEFSHSRENGNPKSFQFTGFPRTRA